MAPDTTNESVPAQGAMTLSRSLAIAWMIGLACWTLLLMLAIAFAKFGNRHEVINTQGSGVNDLTAGFVFGGLAATFILWNFASKGRPYAGALWGVLACCVVCIAWWSALAVFI